MVLYLKIKLYKLWMFIKTLYYKYFDTRKTKLLVLENHFPYRLGVWRYVELTAYLKTYETLVYSLYYKFSSKKEGSKLISQFEKETAIYNKVFKYDKCKSIKADLCYFLFQNNGSAFIDHIERLKIPFVFTLYPGGGLNLKDLDSRNRLKRLLASPYFKEVIVTQNITKQYLLDHKLCDEDQIRFIYGCPMKIENKSIVKENNLDKLRIVFIAKKYMDQGKDKGYDLFIDSIKSLKRKEIEVEAHVFGDLCEKDYPYTIGDINITFHGIQFAENIRAFCKNMDIILSPNRANVLKDGAFDGFPTASVSEAGLQGAAMFLTDELGQNEYYVDGEEIVIIKPEVNNIVEKIEYYNENRDKLHALKLAGKAKLEELFSYDYQMGSRFKVLDQYLERKDD